ncbi:MAG: hypothetical protein HHJ12_11700 [Glaciimonas sp.]|nr:hypothetical protein [Glaciimonas sp.]
MKKYLILAAGLLTCSSLILSSTPALARSDVSVGINIGIPGFYPGPVYMEPQPVYVEQQPVYVQPRVIYTQPRPLYIERGPVYYQGRQWEDRQYRGRHWKDKEHRGHDHEDD